MNARNLFMLHDPGIVPHLPVEQFLRKCEAAAATGGGEAFHSSHAAAGTGDNTSAVNLRFVTTLAPRQYANTAAGCNPLSSVPKVPGVAAEPVTASGLYSGTACLVTTVPGHTVSPIPYVYVAATGQVLLLSES